MGRTIQFESQRVELWAIYAMERDDDVLEYYDQPLAIPLRYRTPSGRMTTQWHVPDFFVLRRSSAGFEEWTSASALAARKRTMPGRYQEEQGVWRCPPGEAYATPLGLTDHIRSSASLHPQAMANFSFLQDYWAQRAPVTAAEEELVLATIETLPGISVAEVLATHPELVVAVRRRPYQSSRQTCDGRYDIDSAGRRLASGRICECCPDQVACTRYSWRSSKSSVVVPAFGRPSQTKRRRARWA
jgi:putative transposase